MAALQKRGTQPMTTFSLWASACRWAFRAGNVNFIIGNSYDENEAVRSAAIELVAKLAEAPKCRQILLANGILGVLVSTVAGCAAAGSYRARAAAKPHSSRCRVPPCLPAAG